MKSKPEKMPSVLPVAGSREARRLVKNKRVPMQTIVLRTLYATGVISTILVAPNALRLFAYLDRNKARRKRFYDRVTQATARLEQRGLISVEENKGRRFIHITEKGRVEVHKILVKNYQIPEQALWDGKWRVLIFDVREERRKTRAILRLLLRSTGFVRLQDSVWVYPYPCDEFVTLARAYLKSGISEIRVIVAETIESDRSLRKHFNLL